MPIISTRDLLNTPGNPAHAIQQRYSELMSITDPDEFYAAAQELVSAHTGGKGISPANARKFFMNLDQAKKRGLTGMQFFVTNFMLKAGGMGVESKAPMMRLALLAETYLRGSDIYRGPCSLAPDMLVEGGGGGRTIPNKGHIKSMQDRYAKEIGPWWKGAEVSAQAVYDRLVQMWSEYIGRGLAQGKFEEFKSVLDDIHWMWENDEVPMYGGRRQYSSEKENLVSYAAYWLTSATEGSASRMSKNNQFTPGPSVRARRSNASEGVNRRPSINETRRAAEFGVDGIAAVMSEDPNDTLSLAEERRRLRRAARLLAEDDDDQEDPGLLPLTRLVTSKRKEKNEDGGDDGGDDDQEDPGLLPLTRLVTSKRKKLAEDEMGSKPNPDINASNADPDAAAFDKDANQALKALQDVIKRYPKVAQAKKEELGKLISAMLK